MDSGFILGGLIVAGEASFIFWCMYRYRNLDTGNHVRKIPKPTWPRTKLEDIFGV